MNLIDTVLIFILTISIIVTFHEYGHYIAARLCGVKVLEFSVGFGKKLIGKNFGSDDTEYKICILPLGGYVKMLDEREGKVNFFEKERAFNNQSLLKRFIIVFSGPLFNFILAIFFYFLIFFSGYEGFKPKVGVVKTQSIAQEINMFPDDIIYSINDKRVSTWSDVTLQVVKLSANEKDIIFEVLRDGDLIKLDTVGYENILLDQSNILENLGVFNFISKTLKIGYVEEGSPAHNSGLKIKDKIVLVNDNKVNNWNEIVNIVKKNPGNILNLYILRNEKYEYLKVTPELIKNNNNKKIGRLGISPFIEDEEIKQNRITVKYGIFESIKLSFAKTCDFTLLTLNFIFKLVKGEVSAKSISGPVGIAGYASDSFESGYTSYFGLLAMLSISIGILNLLPIPMLDGGHLMYYLIEFVTKKPIPERVQLICQQVGVTFLILLSFFALYNDLLRMML